MDVTYDTVGTFGITVSSNKSILGVGDVGVFVGNDAITLNDVDLVWIDYVTTSLIGRQHIVLGEEARNRITISNCHIDVLKAQLITGAF